MGARQVLRVVVAIAALAGGARLAHAQPRGSLAVPAASSHVEPVIVIDLRAPSAARDASRAQLDEALDRAGGVAVSRGGTLDAALAGDSGDDGDLARAALDEAKAAYGALDCAKARPAAERAAIAYASRRASAIDDGDAPRTAWAYVMLCADRDGDHAGAAVAATMLRALGVRAGTEAGIGADTWAKYPDIDARTAGLVELTIKTDASAEIWIDLAKAGAPGTFVVSAGDHVIAAAAGAKRAAQRVAIDKAQTIELALVDREGGGAWADVASTVRGWRTHAPDAAALAAILRKAHARFAFVLDEGGAIALWVLGPGDQVARRVDTGSIDEPAKLAAMVGARVDAWDGRAPDPDRPLLVEDRGAKGKDGKAEPDHWWVYASLIGAVVLGGVVVYEHDSAQDHQRIELRYP
jgi:hypothetical protein